MRISDWSSDVCSSDLRDVRISGANADAKRLIEVVGKAGQTVDVRRPYVTPFRRVLGEIGEATITAGQTLGGLLGFFGATLIAAWNVMRHPRRFRLNAVVQRFEVVGVSALGIIGLLSLLIGIVIAQPGAVQLRTFGAEVLPLNLVGRVTSRAPG